MKRILALILSLAMLTMVLLVAGCGDTPDTTTPTGTKPSEATTGGKTPDGSDGTTGSDNQPQPTTGGSSQQGGEATTGGGPDLTELDGYMKLPGYEDVDFRQKIFVIAARDNGGDWDCYKEIYSADDDSISVAVRKRNEVMEKNYNCKIEVQPVLEPGELAVADIAGNLHRIDLYSVIYSHGSGSSRYNLMNLDIDFTNPWWDQEYVKSYAVKDSNGVAKLYDCIGDFTLSVFHAIYVLIYNRTVYETAGFEEDIYELVRNKEWTMDKFVEMMTKVAKDNDGNGQYKYGDGDLLGWARTGHATHALHVASNLKMIDVKDGVRTFVMPEEVAAWSDVIDKAIEVWEVPQGQTIGYTDGWAACRNNAMLFYSEVLGTLETVKDADVSLGLVPYPLYSESQESYAHYVDNHGMRYGVPLSVPDTDMISDFLELFAYHSRYIVRTAWIDAYSYEYCNDVESGEMLNIILNSRTYDPAYLSYNKEGEISNMISTSKNQMTKWIDRNLSTIEEKIGETVTYLATVD